MRTTRRKLDLKDRLPNEKCLFIYFFVFQTGTDFEIGYQTGTSEKDKVSR